MTDATTTGTPSTLTGGVDFSSTENSFQHRFSQVELQDLREAFRLLDTSQTGKVSVSELLQVLGELQPDATRLRNLHRFYRTVSDIPAHQQFINEEQFIQLIVSSQDNDPRSNLQKVFDLFSAGKEYITLADLSRIANDLGEDITKEELEEMIHQAAPEGEGRVTLKEFSDIMSRKLFSS